MPQEKDKLCTLFRRIADKIKRLGQCSFLIKGHRGSLHHCHGHALIGFLLHEGSRTISKKDAIIRSALGITILKVSCCYPY